MTRTVHRSCTLCEAMCGLTFHVEGERIVEVRNDPLDPFSEGYCCPKGLASGDLHHDPDRLRRPLVRRGGELVEATWEEALTVAAEGLASVIRRRGRDGLGVYVGNPVVHNTGAALGTELWRALLPTRNRYSANSQDVNPHLAANRLMFGMQLSQPIPDLDRTAFLLLVGGNPLVSQGSLMVAPGVGRRLRGIVARGGEVVVVDPRRTETARIASQHLSIRPGTDALLLLCLVREVFQAGAVDRAFVARWTRGVEALEAQVAPFEPEAVAAHTGIAAEAIRDLARRFLAADGAAAYCRLGVSNTRSGGLATWAVTVLNAITGNLDRPGGVMFPEGPSSWLFRHPQGRGSYGRYASPQGCPEVSGEYPCSILAEQVERGLRDPSAAEALFGMVTFAGNPVLSAPNGPRIARALERLEFLVVFDIYRSETAQLADVVLPPRSGLFDPHFEAVFPQFAIADTGRWSPAVLPPPSDHPDEFTLMTQLARRVVRKTRLGGWRRRLLALAAPYLTPTRLSAWVVRFGPEGQGLNPLSRGWTARRLAQQSHGRSPTPMQPRLGERIGHADGRVDLTPAPFLADLPRLVEQLRAERDAASLLLIGRRQLRSNNSWFHNLPSLRVARNRCTALMHPDDAAARGLEDGASIEVRSRVGAITLPLEISDEMAVGVISVPHGWGHQAHGGAVARGAPGVSVNDLTDDAFWDPVTGNSVMNGVPVEVSLAPEPAVIAPNAAGA